MWARWMCDCDNFAERVPSAQQGHHRSTPSQPLQSASPKAVWIVSLRSSWAIPTSSDSRCHMLGPAPWNCSAELVAPDKISLQGLAVRSLPAPPFASSSALLCQVSGRGTRLSLSAPVWLMPVALRRALWLRPRPREDGEIIDITAQSYVSILSLLDFAEELSPTYCFISPLPSDQGL